MKPSPPQPYWRKEDDAYAKRFKELRKLKGGPEAEIFCIGCALHCCGYNHEKAGAAV